MTSIPVIGWFLAFALNASMAVPFWFLWTVMGLGGKYFYFLPSVYTSIGFWNCVGLFVILGILKDRLYPDFSASISAKIET